VAFVAVSNVPLTSRKCLSTGAPFLVKPYIQLNIFECEHKTFLNFKI